MPRNRATREGRLNFNADQRAHQARTRAAHEREAPGRTTASGKDDARKFVNWCRQRLVVPTGRLRGKPFRIPRWQEDWLRGAMDPRVTEAGLSVARKNGKSGLVAAILLAYLVGPFWKPKWRAVVVSLTASLAVELRRQVEEIAKASDLYDDDASVAKRPPLEGLITTMKSPSPGSIRSADGEVTILAADKASGHAVGADLAIVDEAGLLEERKRFLWNNIRSCVSGRDGRVWAISIRGHGPMFTELADREALPSIFWKEYAAPPDADIDDRAAWKAANPGLGTIKSLQHMVNRAASVSMAPADQPYFRAHEMNMQENPGREMVCTPADWQVCEVAGVARLPERIGPCFVGLDLGGSESMSATAVYWPESGRLDVRAAYPDMPTLSKRGQTDGVGNLYDRMVERGELELHPGRVANVVLMLEELIEDLADCDVCGLAADSFRRAEVEQKLDDAGVVWDVDFRANMSGKEGCARLACVSGCRDDEADPVRPEAADAVGAQGSGREAVRCRQASGAREGAQPWAHRRAGGGRAGGRVGERAGQPAAEREPTSC